ncbi:hypothetical protein TWF694_002652 [Orbilia ellipsospora]|uniref:Copper acquisition factor BIM1-like domain-containing protein n=1 Tax=Orbilia ellipsospora TaxID=2528407 RepID=A0AAV9X3X8_9PEZI
MQLKSIVLLGLSHLASAHFLLNSPPTIGFSDDDEGTYPCGSFDATDRKTVTNFPVGGIAVSVTSTHPQDTWFIRAALTNDTENWVELIPPVSQQGQGNFCFSNVPGLAAWENLDAVLQVITLAPDGYLFQCSAIKFVSGAAIPPDAKCTNVKGVSSSILSETLLLDSKTTSTGAAALPAATTGGSVTSAATTGGTATQTGGASSTSSSPSGTTSPNAASRNSGALVALGGILGSIGLFFL